MIDHPSKWSGVVYRKFAVYSPYSPLPSVSHWLKFRVSFVPVSYQFRAFDSMRTQSCRKRLLENGPIGPQEDALPFETSKHSKFSFGGSVRLSSYGDSPLESSLIPGGSIRSTGPSRMDWTHKSVNKSCKSRDMKCDPKSEQPVVNRSGIYKPFKRRF